MKLTLEEMNGSLQMEIDGEQELGDKLFLDGKRWVVVKVEKWKRTCPKCGNGYNEPPALSRRNNKTEICSRCGTSEALEDALGYLK